MSSNVESDFVADISLEDPAAAYETLINEKVQADDVIDDEQSQQNYKSIAAAARKTVWQLLFAEQFASKESQEKAGELLFKLKSDACFYDPWAYNTWIGEVRDELLKRNMLDFWRDKMVAKELGPCWARDSDYFDDMEDIEPAAFYNYAGCVAPFGQVTGEKSNAAELNLAQSNTGATLDISKISSDFEAKISEETPLQDYDKLIKEKVQVDQQVEDDVLKHNYQKIATVARSVIWNMLFSPQPASKERQDKAAELLYKVKADACFYDPWTYNKWICTIREELLKRNMLDFWREQIVENELGPCWARDSDFFHDMEDPEPASFYNHAGCVAPFGQVTGRRLSEAELNPADLTTTRRIDISGTFEPIISTVTPLEDYEALIKQKVQVDQLVEDDTIKHNFQKIATVARDTIWKLLFSDQPTSIEKQDKAAELLYKLKADACFYDPWSYNKWIGGVRDELLKRAMMNFWREKMVVNELGPCWARDCDFFDDMEDTDPADFYKHAGCVAPFSKLN